MKTYIDEYIVGFRDIDRNYDIKIPQLLEILGTVSTKHTNSIGFDPLYLNRQGLAWILYEWKVEIQYTKLYAQPITIETFAVDRKGLYFIRYFGIYDKNGKIIGRASAKWIVINIEKRKITKLPKEMLNIIDFDITSMNENQKWIYQIPNESVKPGNLKDDCIQKIFPIRFYDIDANNHANNVKYVEWAIETLNGDDNFLHSNRIESLNIIYKKETGEKGKIHSKAINQDNTTYHEIYSDNEILLAVLEIVWVKR